MPDSNESTPNVPAPETLSLPPSYQLLDMIEAGLRSNGVEQEFIDEAKRQIQAEITFAKLNPEEKKAKLADFKRQKYGVKSPDAVPMPTPEEMFKMIEAQFVVHKEEHKDAHEVVESVVRTMDVQDKIRRGIVVENYDPKPASPTFWNKIKTLLTFWE